MELRKNPKLDLDKRRGMFFNLGLVISLLLVVTAFRWKIEGKHVAIEDPIEMEFEPMTEVMATVFPVPKRPRPPKPTAIKVSPVPVSKPLEKELKEVIDVAPDDGLDIEIIVEEPEVEEPEEDIIIFAEKNPEPFGGMPKFYAFIAKNMRYPKMARRLGVEGKVFVQFVVDRDGSITEIEVLKSIGSGCDEEAVRVLSKSPKWKPGKQRGRPVKVRMVVPISFKLR